jgi:AAA+ ATPase superfamily predicted ATPase
MAEESILRQLSSDEAQQLIASEPEIGHLLELLELHRRNLYSLEERRAIYGLLETPLQLLNSIEMVQQEIQVLEARLQQSLERAGVRSLLPTPVAALYHNLPRRSPFFVNREAELRAVVDALSPRSRQYLVVIEGIGGVGKTALALEVAYRCLDERLFDGIVWFSGDAWRLEAEALKVATPKLEDMLHVICLVLDRRDLLNKSIDDLTGTLYKAFQSNRYLLVIDNFEVIADQKVFNFVIKLPAPSKTLITSRRQFDLHGKVIKLSGLDDASSIALIRREAEVHGLDDIVHADDTDLWKIFEVTAGLPLAIQWLIGRMTILPPSVVTEELLKARGDLFSSIYELSWKSLSESARNLMAYLPILDDPVRRSEIKSITSFSDGELDDILSELVQVSFLEIADASVPEGPTYHLHPLTRAYSVSRLSETLRVAPDIVISSTHALRRYKRAWREASESVQQSEKFEEKMAFLMDILGKALHTYWEQRLTHHLGPSHVSLLDVSLPFQDLKLPGWLPIVFPEKVHLSEADLNKLRLFLDKHLGVPSRIALIAVLQDTNLSEIVDLARRMRHVYAYDLIPIQENDYLRITLSPDPHKALRTLVLSQVDLASVSPFTITGPVPDNVFFGREDKLRELNEHLTSTSYAVIGRRRIGKSSLLHRLHRVRLPAAGFHTSYHDCSATPTYDAFFTTAIRNWRPEPPLDVPITLDDLLQSPPTDKPLVWLLDEADKLVPTDRANGWPLFNALRALTNSGHAQVVLSGERTLRDALRDSKSPLFNFANEMFLGPLDFRAVEELITRPMKQLEIELIDERTIVDLIWAFTSGHPNVVQRLCRRLIERLNEQGIRRITPDDVNVVVDDPGFQREDFLSTYWEAATSLEKIISLLMADDENVRTLSAVRQALTDRCNLRPKARDTDDALQWLVDLRSILGRTPRGYTFAVESFPRVVAGTMTLSDMLEILTEEHQEHYVRNEA